MNKVQKAGVIILSKEKPTKVGVLYQEKYHDFSFPKGHVESEETPEQCAIRETKEETGLDVELIKPLGKTVYQNVKDGDIDLFFFLGRSVDDTHISPEMGAQLLWMSAEEVLSKLTYQNLKDLFKQVLENEKDLFVR